MDFFELNGQSQFNVQRYEALGVREMAPYSRRDYYKISVVIGKSILHFADRSIAIDRPALVFSNPLVPYSFESEAENRIGYMCIFTEAFLKSGIHLENLLHSTLFKPGSDKVFFLDDEELGAVKKIYQEMLLEHAGDYVFKYDVLRNHTSLLIHRSLKMEPAVSPARHVNAATRITSLFLELLERQFPIDSPDSELTLKKAGDFAKSLSVHVNHLNHAVREVTGKSTSTHIAEYILREAKSLLKHTDWSVSAIAFSLGFEYPTYFNNFFKKNTGMSPLSIRK